jgi:predicted amino acid racemase
VIESKRKPMRPWGTRQRSSFDHRPAAPSAEPERRSEAEPQLAMRTILALGEQDADPASLSAAGLSIEGASSDHLIVSGANPALAVGDEQRFQIGYSSLLRAMTSPFVARCFV